MLNRGETLKLQGSERRVHRTRRRSRSRTIEASLLVEHIVDDVRRRRPAQAAARLRPGARHRRGAEGGAQHRPRPAAGRLRPVRSSARSATLRARAGARRRTTELPKMPLDDAADARRRATRAAIPVQMALGRALRKAGQTDEAMQAFERAAALVPMAAGAGQPARADGGDRAREEGSAARDRRAARRWSPSTSTTSRPRAQLADAAAARTASTDPAKLRPVYERIVAHRSVRRRRARRCSAASRCSATTPTRRRASSARCIALGPVDRAAALHRSRRELSQGRQARRGEEGDARGARDRAELRARAGAAAEAGGRAGSDADAGPRRSSCVARSLLARAGCSSRASTRSCRPRPTIASPACSGASSASRYHFITEGTRDRSRTSTASRGTSTRRRPSRTCRAA